MPITRSLIVHLVSDNESFGCPPNGRPIDHCPSTGGADSNTNAVLNERILSCWSFPVTSHMPIKRTAAPVYCGSVRVCHCVHLGLYVLACSRLSCFLGYFTCSFLHLYPSLAFYFNCVFSKCFCTFESLAMFPLSLFDPLNISGTGNLSVFLNFCLFLLQDLEWYTT